MSTEVQNYRRFAAHFSKTVSKEIKDYVTNVVFKSSRYIFIRRVSGVQFGYCTHCNKRFSTDGTLKHNNKATCPKCKSDCYIKNHGTSRKYMTDRAFFVYYEKSKVNPQAIVARAFIVWRNYSNDYTNVQTEYVNTAKYLFEPGNAEMYENYPWNDSKHIKRQNVISLESQSGYACWCSEKSIRKAIQGTPYQFSTWNEHVQPQGDYVKFFALYSKYPVVELLTKLGFKYFVGAKLYDGKTFNCINWRAKQLHEVLKLSKQDFRIVQKESFDLDPMHLRLFQLSRKDTNPPSIKEIKSFFTGKFGDVMNQMNVILKYTSLRRAMNYIRKQVPKNYSGYRPYSNFLTDWSDYIKDCKQLELDLSLDVVLFPKNLHESHQSTMQLVKTKISELAKLEMIKRAKSLVKLTFEDSKFIIRAPLTTDEIIEEGKQLSHCVAQYAERHAKGNTTILFIRSKDKPDAPFYTMELRNKAIVQTRGFKNQSTTPDVQKFVEKFENVKLKNKRKEVEAV